MTFLIQFRNPVVVIAIEKRTKEIALPGQSGMPKFGVIVGVMIPVVDVIVLAGRVPPDWARPGMVVL